MAGMIWKAMAASRRVGFFREPAFTDPGPDVKGDLARDWAKLLAAHPDGGALARLVGGETPEDWRPSGVTKAEYLAAVVAQVDFWKGHQDAAGAIVDPYLGRERQYATPAFALAAACAVARGGREDLRDAAYRALAWATRRLAAGRAADRHADFYLNFLLRARALLGVRDLDGLFRGLDPRRAYEDTRGWINWNLLNVAGEMLRARDGLVAPEAAADQRAYVSESLARQRRRFTRHGLYADINAPIAYDAFTRMWLGAAVAEGGDLGPDRAWWEGTLALGEATTILCLSPSGEWPCGGRSGHHQWNEAQITLIAETAAARWQGAGETAVAGVFKRAARLAFRSTRRWTRPTGELQVVKNRAEPDARLGFERYSFHSQYNLMTAAMLAMAYDRADDAVEERPAPAERGGYVVDLRDRFHQVIAAAGGYYLSVDTAANPLYQSTGLLRVHRAGVELSPLNDATAPRAYFGTGLGEKTAAAPGLQWREADAWRGLADFAGTALMKLLPGPARATRGRRVASATLESIVEPARVEIRIGFRLEGGAVAQVEERFVVDAVGVAGATVLGRPAGPTRVIFPALVSDGARDLRVTLEGARLEIARAEGVLAWEVTEPAGVRLGVTEGRFGTPNGYVAIVAGNLPAGQTVARWKLTLGGGP